jgi:hypothetical protein
MAITYLGHNHRHWKIGITAVMACICNGNKYDLYGSLFKIQQKCRPTEKMVSKNNGRFLRILALFCPNGIIIKKAKPP